MIRESGIIQSETGGLVIGRRVIGGLGTTPEWYISRQMTRSSVHDSHINIDLFSH